MTFPLIEKPTWSIRDSSKLDDYITCPRSYFFSHILGWRKDIPTHDLHFGNSWHHAREYMLLNGYDDVKGAFTAFLNHYREEFPQETDAIYRPKDPLCVATAIAKFADERKRDLIDNELLMTETSGTVPVDDNRVLHYRMDSVLRNKETGKIFSWDHKSAKKFGPTWEMKFFLGVQNGTYTHCLYCMFPVELVLGVEFCGTCFEFLSRGSKNREAGYHVSFKRVPAYKTPDQMNVWLCNVNLILDDIDRDMDRLFDCLENDTVLQCFQQRPTSCTNYWGCQFHDFCMSWRNPLQQCSEPPLGYKEYFWDPSALETTNKRNLEWK